MHAPAASLLYQRVVAVVSTFSCRRRLFTARPCPSRCRVITVRAHPWSEVTQPWPWIGFLLPLCTSARNIPGRRRQHGVRRGVRLSSLAQGSGEYFAWVGVGTPPTPALLVLDTGSDVVWLQGAPCRRCYALSGGCSASRIAVAQPLQ